MSDSDNTIFSSLGVTPEQILGYLYAGLLSLLCLAIIEPNQVKSLQQTLGGLLLAVSVMTLGIGIFTFYFKIFGEFILFPLQYLIHHGLDWWHGKSGEQHTATMSFLHHLGIDRWLTHHVYQEIKASLYHPNDRRRLQLAHGELHVLYLTGLILVAAGIYSLWIQQGPGLAIMIMGVFS